MRPIDADALKSLAYKGGAFDYQLVVDWSDIVDAPTIDAVSAVHGRWVEFWDEARGKRYGCSVCAASVAVQDDYCHCCGAKMDAPDGSGV